MKKIFGLALAVFVLWGGLLLYKQHVDALKGNVVAKAVPFDAESTKGDLDLVIDLG